MNKKLGIIERTKKWWNDLDCEEQGVVKGTIVGSVVATILSVITAKKAYGKEIDRLWEYSNEECLKNYHRSLKDGEMKGYYNLLTKPENAMKKMGMDVYKF